MTFPRQVAGHDYTKIVMVLSRCYLKIINKVGVGENWEFGIETKEEAVGYVERKIPFGTPVVEVV